MLVTFPSTLIPGLGAFSTHNGNGKTSLFGDFSFMADHWKNLDLENLPNEIWKDVPEYEGYYMASNLGRIKSLSRKVWQNQFQRFAKRVERMLKQKVTADGYLTIVLQVDMVKEYTSAHRCIGTTFIPNPFNLPQINHKDFDRTNNVVENLEWFTCKQNINYTIEAGRFGNGEGEKNINCVLTEDDVREIRKVYKKRDYGLRKRLSDKYGISESGIGKIGLGYTWKHVK